jgi:flagellar biosynthesis protein FlhG
MFLRNYAKSGVKKEELVEEFGTYLTRVLGAAFHRRPGTDTPLFTGEQQHALENYFARCLSNTTLQQLRKAAALVDTRREAEEERLSGFNGSAGTAARSGEKAKGLERELSALLLYLEEEVWLASPLKNHSGLLLFQFALYKLFQSDKFRAVLENFIPRTRDGNSRPRRDRYTQIARLIEGGEEYRREYIALIKRLFPLILRQVELLASTFELDDLLFKEDEGKPDKKVYARLTSGFVHEAINSGLGIMVSFSHRPASVAFEKAAAALLSGDGAAAHAGAAQKNGREHATEDE